MALQVGYDVVIAGAGPAGLTAARTLARLGCRTLVLERQPAPGDLGHPCHGMLSPLPGFISGEQRADGFYYPEVDFHVPNRLVVGCPVSQRYVSPGGYALTELLARGGCTQAVVVEKGRLLDLLADQAAVAGAELQFGNAATGLLWAGRQIDGVMSACGPIKADIVLSAEGCSQTLSSEAGVRTLTRETGRYVVTASQEMLAPGAGLADVGYLMTLGKRYSSAQRGFGAVVTAAPGRATVSFTVFDDRPRYPTDPELWSYLDEYVQNDARVRHLLRGGDILNRSAYQRTLGEGPRQVVRDGFLVAGDAVAPGGHMGVLPAMYVGRWAALTAAEALDAGDPSSAGLGAYDEFIRGIVLPHLGREAHAMWQVTGMTDEEIDRLFALMNKVQRAEPFLAGWSALPWLAAGWLVEQTPLLTDDYELVRRFVAEPGRADSKRLIGNEEPRSQRQMLDAAAPY